MKNSCNLMSFNRFQTYHFAATTLASCSSHPDVFSFDPFKTDLVKRIISGQHLCRCFIRHAKTCQRNTFPSTTTAAAAKRNSNVKQRFSSSVVFFVDDDDVFESDRKRVKLST